MAPRLWSPPILQSLHLLGFLLSGRTAIAYTTSTGATKNTISLATSTELPRISPEEARNFVSSPSNWPKIVLSSNSVQIPNVAENDNEEFSTNANNLFAIFRRRRLSAAMEQPTDLTVPLKVGQSVDEIFGLPPLLPLSVTWKCVESDVKSGRLEFYSENGVPGIASDCRMIFDITDSASDAGIWKSAAMNEDNVATGSSIDFRMEFEPQSIIARLATPILTIDNALALKVLLPLAMKSETGASSSALASIDEFRQLMGTLYGIAGIAHLLDCTVGQSQLLVMAGSPTFYQLPLSGQLYALLWCAAGPISYAASKTGGRAADLGLIFYGAVEIFGAWLLRLVTDVDSVSLNSMDPFMNAIAVQFVVALAWLYSSQRGPKPE